MLDISNDYRKNKEALGAQYLNAWRTEEGFARHDVLCSGMHGLAKELDGLPHPIIKARCLEYLLTKAPIYINPDDYFGIAVEAPKLDPIFDVGTWCHKPIHDLTEKWKSELSSKLNRKEDEDFVSETRGRLFNEFYIDYNHSTPCWEDIFSLGISGIRERARAYRKKHEPLDSEKRAYFDGIEISYSAFIKLLLRYKDALAPHNEPKMKLMKAAVNNLIDNPPRNTYEALLLAWIYWFVQEEVEDMRVRSMGALDRLYLDFYKKDISDGTFTKEDIEELFSYFMNCFYAVRVHYQQPMYLGGVDENGECVVNDLSYIALNAYDNLSAPNPKLQVIISKNTPDAFLRRTLESIRRGNSSISIINHEVAEKALLKFGVTTQEARTYLMSGCWDYAIRNHEVKTVPIRVSLPKILEYTLTGGVCLNSGKTVGLNLGQSFETFDKLVEAYEKQWLYIQNRAMSIIENWEQYLADFSPANLYSATVTDSLERGVDGYARGMKYNNTVYTICGLATLVDSLMAIKKLVFEQKCLSIPSLVEILKNNWQGSEDTRREILLDRDKYGNGSDTADALTVRLVDFFAKNTNLRKNGRGSFWKLGMLSIDKHLRFGALMCATPDGRLSGEPLSKNMSPVIGMDRGGITALINSVSKIDFSNFPHAGILDLILHPSAVAGDDGMHAFAALVRTYFQKGGHSVQFNVFSASTLIDAQANPERYKNLQVRVCGWNVYFIDLEKPLQDAFIQEAKHREGCGTAL